MSLEPRISDTHVPPSCHEGDLPPVRFHDLRHGAASLSLAAGNDLKTGHDSIVLTADTYTSVLPCLAHQAAEALTARNQAATPAADLGSVE